MGDKVYPINSLIIEGISLTLKERPECYTQPAVMFHVASDGRHGFVEVPVLAFEDLALACREHYVTGNLIRVIGTVVDYEGHMALHAECIQFK